MNICQIALLNTYFLSPGLDNAFVILNSWHRSDKKASVEDRLGDTMSEAGVSRELMMIFSRGFFITILKIFQVSILITSLTDADLSVVCRFPLQAPAAAAARERGGGGHMHP